MWEFLLPATVMARFPTKVVPFFARQISGLLTYFEEQDCILLVLP